MCVWLIIGRAKERLPGLTVPPWPPAPAFRTLGPHEGHHAFKPSGALLSRAVAILGQIKQKQKAKKGAASMASLLQIRLDFL